MIERAKFSRLFSLMMAIILAFLVVFTPAVASATTTFIAAKSSVPSLTTQPAEEATQPEQANAVTLVNRFEVPTQKIEAFLDRWSSIGEYVKKQPGFISAELKKDIVNSKDWIMSEKWSSLAAYKKAVSTQEFQALIEDFPGKANWFAQDFFPSR